MTYADDFALDVADMVGGELSEKFTHNGADFDAVPEVEPVFSHGVNNDSVKIYTRRALGHGDIVIQKTTKSRFQVTLAQRHQGDLFEVYLVQN